MTKGKFPTRKRSWSEVEAAMEEARQQDIPWHGEHMFLGGSYYAGDDVVEVANQAYQMYINYNALFAGKQFPSLSRYAAEVVDALLDLLNAPPGAGGSLTSGGTESIMMAVNTAQAWARDHRPRAAQPEIVLPRAAHPAFDKAAHLMGIKTVRMSESPEFRADVAGMARAINDNTIMIAGSAPAYSYGVTDPIAELATLAAKDGLWLHVDACHGGFVLPFARKLGYAVPDFDFELAGVTSISVDVHKLGYANKGVSALLFRDEKLEAYQRYTFDEWPSGLYTTRNLTGSRSGGGLASAWAVLNYLGEEGYLEIVGEILDARRRLVDGIGSMEELEVWGEPHAYLIAFGSKSLDIFAVHEGMADRGWLSNLALEPPSIHLFLDRSNATGVDRYLRDLAEVVEEVKAGRIRSRGEQAVYAV